jgi:hypothetical protein
MTQSADDFKKQALDKWVHILNSMGVTGSKSDWMSQYVNEDFLKQPQQEFPSILPMSMSIAMDLVSVQPMKGSGGTSKEEMERIKAEIKAENRDSKIDSIIEDTDYTEKKIEEHPDYKGPEMLFYFDYRYENSTSSSIDNEDNSILGKLGRGL